MRVNVVLFLATIVTTTLVGTMHGLDATRGMTAPTIALLLGSGIPFSATLLGILLAHEMGHYVTARRHRVRASLPYFIPFPVGTGTLGAVIRMRSVPRDRGILLMIGAMGPLIGLVVALPLAAYGLAGSERVALAGVADGQFQFGNSILTWLLTRLTVGHLPPGIDIYFTPMALAAWFGLFLTALNLTPVGQLDGGHIVYGLFGTKHGLISHLAFLAVVTWGLWGGAAGHAPPVFFLSILLNAYAVFLIFSGPRTKRKRNVWILLVAAWVVLSTFYLIEGPVTTLWLVWSAVLYSFGLDHPPTRDLHHPLDLKRKIVGWFCVLIFILTFVPEPIRLLGPID